VRYFGSDPERNTAYSNYVYYEEQIPDAVSNRSLIFILAASLLFLATGGLILIKRKRSIISPWMISISEKVDAVIKEKFSEKLSRDQMAKEVGLSGGRMTAIYRQVRKTTPMQILTKVRIEQAKSLLSESDLSLTQVGDKCGIPNAQLFFRHFKQDTGMTPQDYRNKNRKKM